MNKMSFLIFICQMEKSFGAFRIVLTQKPCIYLEEGSFRFIETAASS
jgi:hypothetical protein